MKFEVLTLAYYINNLKYFFYLPCILKKNTLIYSSKLYIFDIYNLITKMFSRKMHICNINIIYIILY